MEKILDRISCHNFIIIDGYAFFSNWFYNGLFKTEIKTGATTFLGHFKNEILFERNIHWQILLREDEIFFLPKRGRHVHIYNLTGQSMCSIEVRKESDEFFVIKEIFYSKDYFIFVPSQENLAARKIDLNTLKLSEISERSMIYGKYLSQCQCESIPSFSYLMKKNNIEWADRISWKRMSDGKKCAFMPKGRELLLYSEKTNMLNKIPLIVVNNEELGEYLNRVKQLFLRDCQVLKDGMLELTEYLNEIVKTRIQRTDVLESDICVGRAVWDYIQII